MTERTLAATMNGLKLYREWAAAILEADAKQEPVPTPGDVDAMVEWLDARGLIVEPVDVAQARVLIVLVQAGGEHTFEED